MKLENINKLFNISITDSELLEIMNALDSIICFVDKSKDNSNEDITNINILKMFSVELTKIYQY